VLKAKLGKYLLGGQVTYHMIVKGIPVSIQSSSRSKNAWKSKVANEARAKFTTPLVDNDLKVRITIFYNGVPTYDSNNMSKPICDAMCGIAYNDDRQIMEQTIRMKSLDGSYKIKGVPLELAVAMCEGADFVWIEISKVGSEVENL